MKLFLLQRYPAKWCENQAAVVRARDEAHARELAGQQARDEGAEAWQHATCDQLHEDGEPDVILIDYKTP